MLCLKKSPQFLSLRIVGNSIEEEHLSCDVFVGGEIVLDVVDDDILGHLGSCPDHHGCVQDVVSNVLIKCALNTCQLYFHFCYSKSYPDTCF